MNGNPHAYGASPQAGLVTMRPIFESTSALDLQFREEAVNTG